MWLKRLINGNPSTHQRLFLSFRSTSFYNYTLQNMSSYCKALFHSSFNCASVPQSEQKKVPEGRLGHKIHATSPPFWCVNCYQCHNKILVEILQQTLHYDLQYVLHYCLTFAHAVLSLQYQVLLLYILSTTALHEEIHVNLTGEIMWF